MHENAHTVAKEFSRRGEVVPSISGTFVRLNVWDYKRAEQSNQSCSCDSKSLEISCVFEHFNFLQNKI